MNYTFQMLMNLMQYTFVIYHNTTFSVNANPVPVRWHRKYVAVGLLLTIRRYCIHLQGEVTT
jgi:hypothetical protein